MRAVEKIDNSMFVKLLKNGSLFFYFSGGDYQDASELIILSLPNTARYVHLRTGGIRVKGEWKWNGEGVCTDFNENTHDSGLKKYKAEFFVVMVRDEVYLVPHRLYQDKMSMSFLNHGEIDEDKCFKKIDFKELPFQNFTYYDEHESYDDW